MSHTSVNLANPLYKVNFKRGGPWPPWTLLWIRHCKCHTNERCLQTSYTKFDINTQSTSHITHPSSLLVCCKACTVISCTSWYFEQSLVPFTSVDMQLWVPPTTEVIQIEPTSTFRASCSQYLNLFQTCRVNTFHIELIHIQATGSSSVNGLCYELWKSRKNHFFFMNLIKISTILH